MNTFDDVSLLVAVVCYDGRTLCDALASVILGYEDAADGIRRDGIRRDHAMRMAHKLRAVRRHILSCTDGV
jgi:hypothetical protein